MSVLLSKIEKEYYRSGTDRRRGIDRRHGDNSHYIGPERRIRQDRRYMCKFLPINGIKLYTLLVFYFIYDDLVLLLDGLTS